MQNWSDDGKQIFAVGSLVHAQLEEHPDLDAGVNHAADPEYWKQKKQNFYFLELFRVHKETKITFVKSDFLNLVGLFRAYKERNITFF